LYAKAVLKFAKLNTVAQQREAVTRGRSLLPYRLRYIFVEQTIRYISETEKYTDELFEEMREKIERLKQLYLTTSAARGALDSVYVKLERQNKKARALTIVWAVASVVLGVLLGRLWGWIAPVF
jgi:hypothetical protein